MAELSGTGAEEGAALARADAFVAKVLTRLAPLTFGVAVSPAELKAVFRLRYEVVMHRGWAKPADFPNGLERDAFDDRALQIAAWADNELVGTTRLVAPQAELPLPTEQAFDLNITSRGRVIDMGRTCRSPRCNDTGHRIIWGLLCQSWIEMRRGGFAEICGIFSPGMTRFYERFGCRIEILGEPRLHWGEQRHPVLIRPAEFVDRLHWPLEEMEPAAFRRQ
jgi:N-acyl-L-homoserine lactone synthetase